MRFWRSDDQRIQWLAAKFGKQQMEVRHVHFNLGQCHRQFSQEKSPNMFPLHVHKIRGKEMNITDPIYADEDKAREHLESIQFHQSVAS
jgi:hypothetical protein